MIRQLEKGTLVELEYELNRRDILHCRSLIIEIPSSAGIVIATPPPVEHGYVFKSGDYIDLYASLLSKGDAIHTLHFKTRVIRTGKTDKGPYLHLKRCGFVRVVSRKSFFMLRSNDTILLEPENDLENKDLVPVTVHSITLTGIHITALAPLSQDQLWNISLYIGGTIFNFQGKAEPDKTKNELTNDHPATIHFTGLSDELRMELAEVIESIHKNHILPRTGLSLHEIYDISNIQDSMILQHLVARSWQRRFLDGLELIGWLILILAAFNIVLAIPPGGNLFDRFFQIQRAVVWDQDQLKNVPFLLGSEFFICISAFLLHQFIYYRGNSRTRWSLWTISLLSVLVFLTVRTHL